MLFPKSLVQWLRKCPKLKPCIHFCLRGIGRRVVMLTSDHNHNTTDLDSHPNTYTSSVMVSRYPPRTRGFQTLTQDKGFPDTHPGQWVSRHPPRIRGFQTLTQDKGVPDTHTCQRFPDTHP